jgi:predicted DCC family thiol-disulfide oxidoreductase YuxK
MAVTSAPNAVILIDGTCIFCNRFVRAILRLDRKGHFHFAHIQGRFAAEVLARHAMQPDIDAIYLVDGVGTPGERVLVDGAASRVIWPRIYPIGAAPVALVPVPLLNVFYRAFARVRYRLFGQYSACVLPSEQERARFVD